MRLAQSILKRKFPSVETPPPTPAPKISHSKRAFEKYKPRGLFSEFYGSFVSVRSSSRSSFNIFGDRPNRYGVYTAPKCGTKTYPIRDAPLSRSAWCSFPLVTEISTPQLSFMCAWTEALSGMILVARAKAVWIVTLHSSMASTCTTERLPQIAHLIKCRRTVRGLRVQFLRKMCKFRSSRELLSGFVSTSIKREIRHVHVVVLRWRQRTASAPSTRNDPDIETA